MKFFIYDIKSRNKPENLLNFYEIFQFYNIDCNNILEEKNIVDEYGNISDLDIKQDTIDYFEELKILEPEFLVEFISQEDFDIASEENVYNSVFFYNYENTFFLKKLNYALKKIKYEHKKKQEKKKEEEEKKDPNLDHFNFFLKLEYDKKFIKNRKIHSLTRPGVSESPKKNSLFRNKNISILKQLLSIFTKKGCRKTTLKHHNTMYYNFYDIFKNKNNTDLIKNFEILKKSLKNDPKAYYDFNNILSNHLPIFNSLFDIKSKKNKRIKNKSDFVKYSYEIIYIKKDKRVRNTLKIIELYNESFKSYFFWERLLLMYLSVIINWQDSFLIKRRLYVYTKSVKFFRVNSQKKNYA